MSRESFENKVVDTQDIKEGTDLENSYQRYLELGGIINEQDYESALAKAKNTTKLAPVLINEAKGIARFAGIELHSTGDVLDPKIVLYVILRNDTQPEDVKYHHSQMSDQRIFGEVLRILGDADSLDKLIKAYPNISFKYKRGK